MKLSSRVGVSRSRSEILVMNTCLSGATEAAWRTGALTACMLIAVGGSLPAWAAERTVLCEEFTNIW